jgi:creatinine amidohydrolase
MFRRTLFIGVIALICGGMVWSAEPPSSRYLADLNWQEFQKLVPTEIQTVLIPVGTIEAHGAINNGADCTVPEEFARRFAEPLNALIAPLIPYGVTKSLTRYPGAIRISPETFERYVYEVAMELARNGFKNLIFLNGHGGNRESLDKIAEEITGKTKARVLVFDWWSYTGEIVYEVFGEDGGHAGNNETAAIMAINPKLVKKELYRKDLAGPRNEAVTAYPNPYSIILYKPGQGYPDFDMKKAKTYFDKVSNKCLKLIQDVIAAWDRNGL